MSIRKYAPAADTGQIKNLFVDFFRSCEKIQSSHPKAARNNFDS
jgi:hypothetical protein